MGVCSASTWPSMEAKSRHHATSESIVSRMTNCNCDRKSGSQPTRSDTGIMQAAALKGQIHPSAYTKATLGAEARPVDAHRAPTALTARGPRVQKRSARQRDRSVPSSSFVTHGGAPL